jgi:Glycosyl transferases group 1
MTDAVTFHSCQQSNSNSLNTGSNTQRIGFIAVRDGMNTAWYLETAAEKAMGKIDRVQDPNDLAMANNLDLLIVVDPCLTSPLSLKKASCAVVGYLIDVHQGLQLRLAYARYFDHVFVAQSDYLLEFRSLGHPSVHALPLACDPNVHFVPDLVRDIDVGFVGKLGHKGSDRFVTLSRVLDQFATNDRRHSLTVKEMGAIYSRSKIVFNKSINGDLNMRFFEGLASGALLVTNRIGNGLNEIAKEGEHFVGYGTADEAIDKIEYYLSHDAEREAIGRRGQELAFSKHTMVQRIQSMIDTVQSNREARAPARDAPARVEAFWRSECLRLQGAPIGEVAAFLAQGNLSRATVASLTVAVARGVVRPLRQRLQRMRTV